MADASLWRRILAKKRLANWKMFIKGMIKGIARALGSAVSSKRRLTASSANWLERLSSKIKTKLFSLNILSQIIQH
jgi:hypothetical protein